MTADRRAIKLNIDEAKFLEAIDREGDHEIGAGTLTSDRRAALVEKVARLICEGSGEDPDGPAFGVPIARTYPAWMDYADTATAAIDLIRAEVLEEEARVIENNCHDDMTRAEEAAAIRALKEAPCSSS